MEGRGKQRNLEILLQWAIVFCKLATEFGKIYRGKLWALLTTTDWGLSLAKFLRIQCQIQRPTC